MVSVDEVSRVLVCLGLGSVIALNSGTAYALAPPAEAPPSVPPPAEAPAPASSPEAEPTTDTPATDPTTVTAETPPHESWNEPELEPPPEPPPAASVPAPAATVASEAKPLTRDDVLKARPDLHKRHRDAKKWAIGGGVTGGIGLLFMLQGGAWLALHNAASPDARANLPTKPLGYVMLVGGALAFVPGVAIMSIGLRRRAEVHEEVDDVLLSARPWIGPGSGGLAMTFRLR